MRLENDTTYVCGTGTCIQTPEKLRAFHAELKALCQKYGISIAHEDSSGGFELEPYNDACQNWIESAGITAELAKQLEQS